MVVCLYQSGGFWFSRVDGRNPSVVLVMGEYYAFPLNCNSSKLYIRGSVPSIEETDTSSL